MRRIITIVVIFVTCLFNADSVLFGQMVGTNTYLRGRYLEVGMTDFGAFGTNTPPSGYHPYPAGSYLGEVYDIGHDGWTSGAPASMGDYTYPGSPYEGWGIQAGGTSGLNWAFASNTSITGPGSLAGHTVSYSNTGGTAIATWAGTTAGGQLAVHMYTSIDTNASWVVMKVVLINTGTTPLDSIYYFRGCDPDNDEAHGGTFSTDNVVSYQNDVYHRVLVSSTGQTYPSAYMGLGTKDSRAKALVYESSPLDFYVSDLSTVYIGTAAIVPDYAVGLADNGDYGIGLVFNLGTIVAGDSAVFSYSYTFNGVSGIDSAFESFCSGTPVAGAVTSNSLLACATTTVTLTDTGSTALASYQWQSSPDSISWGNIAGANSVEYTFSGMASTTYYRCIVSCAIGGASDTTTGIRISYTTSCPCVLVSAGTITSNVPYACATATVTLTDAGYSASAATLQWQSSPDSTTWVNISGATSATYSFSGLSATTYYCMNVVCISGGSSEASAGLKVRYSATCICTGTPDAGAATASTTSCSSCSLTLNLSGASIADSLQYQWQTSPDSLAWTNIAGATTVPYTFTPYTTYYYRCLVTCAHSGGSAASSGIKVAYTYRIISHAVINTPDTVCSGSEFYLEANGASSLLSVKTRYGDNTTDSVALIPAITTSSVSVTHVYSCPGNYTVKQVLYWNNIPQDSVAFSYEDYYCRILPIKFYYDVNGNCVKESTEAYISTPILVQVDSNSIPVNTISATSGLYYQTRGLPGTVYSFRIIPGAYTASCPASAVIYDTVVSTVNTYPVKYYGLSCTGTGFDLAVTDAAPVTGPHDQIGYIYVSNNFCGTMDGTVTVYYDKRYSSSFNMRGSSMAPVSRTDSSATWNISGLSSAVSPVELSYQVWAPSGSLVSGDTVYSRVIVSPNAGDVNTSNNIEIIKDTINDCEDPNQIFVSPTGCLPDTTTQLQYTILFTNVGTDTAFNVYVMDTLPNEVDAKSLRLIMASNTMNIAQYNDGGYNIVKFDFPGINLLDTNACPQCSGQVVFSITTLAGMPAGTTVFNHAGIFFDDNPVVMTDTVENSMGNCLVPTNVKNNIQPNACSVNISPNPATNELTIKMSQGAYTSLIITNSIGQQMLSQPLSQTQTQVSVGMLPAGLYYITFRGDNGTSVQKFVKM